MSIVVVGAYIRDLYMFGNRLPGAGETVECIEYEESHGGKGANQAVAAARLGSKTVLVAKLGNDDAGYKALQVIKESRVDSNYIAYDDANKTGTGFIVVDQQGIQLITTYAGSSNALIDDDLFKAKNEIQHATVLLLQGEINYKISQTAMSYKGEQTVVILDPSPIETFQGCKFDDIDIITPNELEAQHIIGSRDISAENVAIKTGVNTVLLTRGNKGVEFFNNGLTMHVPVHQVPVVDTTGAGDAFNGALAAGIDQGLSLIESVRQACECASFSVSRRFCIPSFPWREDVNWHKP